MTTKVLNIFPIKKTLRPLNLQAKDESLLRNEAIMNLLKKHSNLRDQSIKLMTRACAKYKFRKDTLFLAIKLLDNLIQKIFAQFFEDSQLVAACLILLATKYNEVYPVSIDQMNLITQKYYPRQDLLEVEGLILQAINFEFPQSTVYSQLYNQLEPNFNTINSTDSDKQNDSGRQNKTQVNDKVVSAFDEKSLVSKVMKAITEPECFKFGQETLFNGLLCYFKKMQNKRISIGVIKLNYIKTVLKRLFEPETPFSSDENGKVAFIKCLSPKTNNINPEVKYHKLPKLFCF